MLEYDRENRERTSLLMSEYKLIVVMVIVFILILFTIGSIIKTTNCRKCMKRILSMFGVADTSSSQRESELESRPRQIQIDSSGYHQELSLTERGAPSARRIGNTNAQLPSTARNGHGSDDEELDKAEEREWWEDYEFNGRDEKYKMTNDGRQGGPNM